MKAYDLLKSHFEFNMLDVTMEFNEYIEFVFVRKETLFFVFYKDFKETKNPKGHIKEYYKSRGWKKVKFLKQ